MKQDIRYKTILFDADRTLLDFDKSQYEALKRTYELFGVKYQERYNDEFVKVNNRLWEMHEKNLIKREVLIYERFNELLKQQKLELDYIKFEDEYQELLSSGAYLIKGAFEVVENLSKKHDIYIVTNGVHNTQTKRLKATGILKYIKDVFISEDIGVPKPAKEYFDRVFNKIFISSKADKDITQDINSTIIIGDSLTSDIRGGNNANIDTCWYNPKHAVNNQGVNITYEITALEDLYNIL